MSRRLHPPQLRLIILVAALPLLFVSVGYALFQDSLTVQGSATTSGSTEEPDDFETNYSVNSWGTNPTSYNFNPFTITNTGTTASIAWTLSFDAPANMTNLSCWGSVCAYQAGKVVFDSMSYNGVVNPSSSISFGFSFASTDANFTPQNIVVTFDDGVANDNQYVEVPGLTATINLGSGWGSYIRQYDFSVQNNSGQNVKSWRLEITNWTKPDNSVVNMWNVTYIESSNKLTMASSGALSNGSSASFGGQLQAPSSAWYPTYIVKGRL